MRLALQIAEATSHAVQIVGDRMRKEVIGNATLYLGDCLTVIPQLEGVGVVITDPPYGIAWKRGVNNARNSKQHEGILNDEDTSTRDAALELLKGIPGMVFGSFYAPYPQDVKQVLVWHKPPDSGLVGSVTGFRRDAEPIFMVGPWPQRTVEASSVIHLRRGQAATTAETGHPHTKPVGIMEALVAQSPAGIVLDPFMGSGSTGVACHRYRRAFIGIEIHEPYFDIACQRIENAQRQERLFA